MERKEKKLPTEMMDVHHQVPCRQLRRPGSVPFRPVEHATAWTDVYIIQIPALLDALVQQQEQSVYVAIGNREAPPAPRTHAPIHATHPSIDQSFRNRNSIRLQ